MSTAQSIRLTKHWAGPTLFRRRSSSSGIRRLLTTAGEARPRGRRTRPMTDGRPARDAYRVFLALSFAARSCRPLGSPYASGRSQPSRPLEPVRSSQLNPPSPPSIGDSSVIADSGPRSSTTGARQARRSVHEIDTGAAGTGAGFSQASLSRDRSCDNDKRKSRMDAPPFPDRIRHAALVGEVCYPPVASRQEKKIAGASHRRAARGTSPGSGLTSIEPRSARARDDDGEVAVGRPPIA